MHDYKHEAVVIAIKDHLTRMSRRLKKDLKKRAT